MVLAASSRQLKAGPLPPIFTLMAANKGEVTSIRCIKMLRTSAQTARSERNFPLQHRGWIDVEESAPNFASKQKTWLALGRPRDVFSERAVSRDPPRLPATVLRVVGTSDRVQENN
jgi:hypothetical protein